MKRRSHRGLFRLGVLALLLPACGDETVNNDDVAIDSTVRVSLGVDGREGNASSSEPSISGDGSRVAFTSKASNLHPDDPDSISDIYVRDLKTNTTILVSRAGGASGSKGNAASRHPAITPDGRYVVFESLANNLHPDDPGSDIVGDIYLRDLETHSTRLISRATGLSGAKYADNSAWPSISDDSRYTCFLRWSAGMIVGLFLRDEVAATTTQIGVSMIENSPSSISGDASWLSWQVVAGASIPEQIYTCPLPAGSPTINVSRRPGGGANDSNGINSSPRYSADGFFVAFQSQATNLSPTDDDNGRSDIYLWERLTDQMTRVSLTNSGDEASGDSIQPSPSADARFIAFASNAGNLVNGDLNGSYDIFVRDRILGTTVRVSIRTYGLEANGDSLKPSLSRDGRFVAFESYATNMVGGDTNTAADIFLRGIGP